MKLKLKQLDHYVTGVERVNDRRSTVRVLELVHQRRASLRRDHVLTGRSWSLRYDPMVVTETDLSRLIDAKISGTPPPESEPAHPVTDEFLEVLGTVLAPIMRMCINNMVNAINERMEDQCKGKRVEPEQVIIEQEYERTLEKLVRKLTPVVAKATQQIAEARVVLAEHATTNCLHRLFWGWKRV